MIDIRIPKEIKKYKEKYFLGLTLRQSICAIIALAINVSFYIFARPYIGDDLASWIIILNAIPIFLIGFYQYNGMNFEQFLVAVFKYGFLYPRKRKYISENLYEILIDEDKKLEKKMRKKSKKKYKK